MSNATDLLRRALDCIDWHCPQVTELREKIRTYLSNPSDDAEEPVAWMREDGVIGNYNPSDYGYGTKVFPLYLHPPKPAEPEAEYDLSQVIPLTHRKAKGIIKDRGYHVTGFVLSRPDGDKSIVDMSAVRWLTGKEFFEMMHPPVVSPTAEPAARKPMTEMEVGEEILRNADEWSKNFANGFVFGIRYAEKHHDITNADL
jgi:hypothetical protein